MWPFNKLNKQEARLRELEERIMGLERCIIVLSDAVKHLANVNDMNVEIMEQNFASLANYCMTPRTQIMGDTNQEQN